MQKDDEERLYVMIKESIQKEEIKINIYTEYKSTWMHEIVIDRHMNKYLYVPNVCMYQ